MSKLDVKALIKLSRANFAKIDRIDPCCEPYKRLIAILDACDQPALRMIEMADIKFVSALARNRLK